MQKLILEISETAKDRPSNDESCRLFNVIREEFSSLKDLQDYIKNRYGKLLKSKGRDKIYRDSKVSPDELKAVGFLFSYWNKDCSHDSKPWWQTDWITIIQREYTDKVVML
jgi:hypothetical protein